MKFLVLGRKMPLFVLFLGRYLFIFVEGKQKMFYLQQSNFKNITVEEKDKMRISL